MLLLPEGNAQYGQQQEPYQQGPPQQQGYPPQQQYPGQQGYPPQQQGYGESEPPPLGGALRTLQQQVWYCGLVPVSISIAG